jgi:hypothetical protein
MAIAYVTTANTFQQWLISSQDLITTANNLTDGGGAKTFYANTNVVVGNNLTVVGNTTITGDLTVTGNITLDSLGFDDLAVNGSANIANTLTVAGVATMANANVAILSGTSNTAIYTYIASVEASALAFSIALG